MKNNIDKLLQKPYWIIDLLPAQVPEDSPGQFFEIERFFLERNNLASIKQKHINVLLKLNCYCQISIDGEVNPSPEKIADAVMKRSLQIMVGESMIASESDDTYMTVYNPDDKLLELIKTIAVGEGLYVWKP